MVSLEMTPAGGDVQNGTLHQFTPQNISKYAESTRIYQILLILPTEWMIHAGYEVFPANG
jgi:hypothetical protein